jgi:hypothetical protein
MKSMHLALAGAILVAAAACPGDPIPGSSAPGTGSAPIDAAAPKPPQGSTAADAATPAPDTAGPPRSDAAPPPVTADAAPDAAADARLPDAAALAPLASRSVGYARSSLMNYPALAASVDLRKLTHLILSFANPTATAPLALSSSDADVALMVNAAHAAGVKVLVAIGGSTGTPRVLPQLAPDKLKAFVQTVLDFADARGFDGVDVDVEDANITAATYEALVMGLSAGLKPKQKLLTAAVARWFDGQITAAALAQMDFISVMAYDGCNSSAPTPCQHSTYETAMRDLDHYVNTRKVPASKVVLGVPFYGYCWGTGCASPAMTYAEILQRYPGSEDKDLVDTPDAKVYFNGRATIERKAKLGRSHGGVMFWHLAGDAVGPRSLLDVIAGALSDGR